MAFGNRFISWISLTVIIYAASASCEISQITPEQPVSLLQGLNQEQQGDISNIGSGDASITPNNYPKHGINVQTGYEGYLVPTTPDVSTFEKVLDIFGILTKKGTLSYFIKSLIPKITSIAIKVGTVAFALTILFLAGAILTSLICTFTPFCSVHFSNLNWNSDITEETVRGFITPEKMSSLTTFVNNAIKQYKKKFEKKSKMN